MTKYPHGDPWPELQRIEELEHENEQLKQELVRQKSAHQTLCDWHTLAENDPDITEAI